MCLQAGILEQHAKLRGAELVQRLCRAGLRRLLCRPADLGTNETVIRGLGDMHLRAKLLRMEQQFKLSLTTSTPQIAYIETITGNAEGHCRHKKQSGGAGQFGEVMLRVEPLARGAGFEFVDVVKGGAIPGVFMAAVEKGVLQALAEGAVAGFPVHDLRVTVFDGKTHAVDGKEVAFVAAARKATLQAVRAAKPIVWRPDEQNRFTVAPGTVTGQPAASAA